MELEELLNILTQFPDSEQKKELISKAEGLTAKTNYFKEKYGNRTDEEAVKESRNLEKEINEYHHIAQASIGSLTSSLKERIKIKQKTNEKRTSLLADAYYNTQKDYQNFTKAIEKIKYTLDDITHLIKRLADIPPYYGIFISALINKIIKPDDTIIFDISQPLDSIGYMLTQGKMIVTGPVEGRETCAYMTGGEVILKGKTSGCAGIGMTGGLIEIMSADVLDVGQYMKGGKILVHKIKSGRIGDSMYDGFIEVLSDAEGRIGAGMKEGKIIVHGKAGKDAGYALDGGTIELMSDAGDNLGKDMRRGKIIAHGKAGKDAGINRHGGIIELLGGYESIGPAAKDSYAQILVG